MEEWVQVYFVDEEWHIVVLYIKEKQNSDVVELWSVKGCESERRGLYVKVILDLFTVQGGTWVFQYARFVSWEIQPTAFCAPECEEY